MRSGVCFDATGTLFEAAESIGEIYRRVALDFGVDLPAWRLDDAFRRILAQAPPRSPSTASRDERRAAERDWWRERIRQTFQATDSTVRFADFPAFAARLFDAFRRADVWRVRPGIDEVLATLRRAGCPLAVVSNFDHRLLEVLEVLDLKSYFDFVAIPSTLGLAKPARALFSRVGKALDRPLERLVYVGDDDPETLAAIEAHGLRVIDVRRAVAPDALLASLAAAIPLDLPG